MGAGSVRVARTQTDSSYGRICQRADSTEEHGAGAHATITEQCHELDALLVVDNPAEWSTFGRLCQHAGAVTKANIRQMIERLHSLPVTLDTAVMLTGIAAVSLSSGRMKRCDCRPQNCASTAQCGAVFCCCVEFTSSGRRCWMISVRCLSKRFEN